MSWHFSQALVAASSAGNCSAGAPSAPSSKTPTHGMSWSPGKTTEACTRSRSGMMYAPLTANRGEALLTWFREVSRARTSAQPEKAQESQEAGQGFGQKWHALSVKYNPNTHGWKTLHCLFPEDLDWSYLTLPRWGMMRNGELWGRTMPALPTNGIESGYWRTPGAQEPGISVDRLVPIEGGTLGGMNRHFDKHTGRMAQIGLSQQVKLRMWPTPTASEDAAGRPGSKMQKMLGNHPEIRGDCSGGSLNPDWVEWLMIWPIGWTNTRKDCSYEALYWKEASTTNVSSDSMRSVWLNEEAGAPPQRPRPDKQRSAKCGSPVPQVSHASTPQDCSGGSLRGMRQGVCSQEKQAVSDIKVVRESVLFSGDRARISRTAVGIPNRADRLRCIGNGQVPQAMKLAWELLS